MRSAVALSPLLVVSCYGASMFFSVGDWGGQDTSPYYTPGEQLAAERLGVLAKNSTPAFVLLNGDNFYSSGIQGDVHSPRFQETFEQPFDASDLEDVQFWVNAGNHDHKGNVSAQIAYTQLSKRWNYPDYFYTFSKTLESEDGDKEYSVDIVMIDTVIMTGITDNETEIDVPREVLQTDWYAWIAQQLAQSKADFVFVAGHYPVWSPGSHGPTQDLVDKLAPLLEKYGAHYLCGHDHIQAHIENNNVAYVVAGSFHECCYAATHKQDIPAGALKYIHAAASSCPKSEEDNRRAQAAYAPDATIEELEVTADSGFAGVYFSSSGFEVKYYDNLGNVRYTSRAYSARSL